MTSARPLRRDAAENRERVLAAATAVFDEHGLDAGVEQVARAAGVGMGTLYRRFPSKQALIDELVGTMRAKLRDIARDAIGRDGGTALELLLSASGELVAEHSGCLRQLWAQSDAQLDAIDEFRSLLPAVLADAQRHGRIRADVVVTDVSMALWSVSAVIETTSAAAPNAWRRHLDVVIAGLRPPSSQLAAELTHRPMTEAQVRKVTATLSR